ncbi:MAG: class I SAM-dependent methyltransferase [Sphingobacteriia bacterium]|jgi:SAM-dependent methyltransferase
MNWTRLRSFLWIDTRFKFIGNLPLNANLLDIGSSNGETINHFKEARPDLDLFSTDIDGQPEKFHASIHFQRADITKDTLPWNNESMHGITCMHLVEHINTFDHFFKECFRLLKPGTFLYIETPHPKTLYLSMPYSDQAGKFTYNFWDDLTHVQLMPIGKIAALAAPHGFTVTKLGTSRNWLFAFLFPFSFLLPSRKKIISRVHFIGWSSYIILKKN